MSNQTVTPPDLDDVLGELKNSIFATLNCIQIGKIEKVNDNQTVEIQLQFKRRVKNSETIDYPVLVDCPYFVLQGGGAFIEMPIKPGDYCIILFNDRNIDTWWDTANVKEPLTRRKHSLSDGLALVGINPVTALLNMAGDIMRLNATGFPFKIETDKKVEVQGSTVELNGDSKSFVTHSELNTALQGFVTKYNADMAAILAGATAAIAASGLWLTPLTGIGSATLDISASSTTTIKTGG